MMESMRTQHFSPGDAHAEMGSADGDAVMSPRYHDGTGNIDRTALVARAEWPVVRYFREALLPRGSSKWVSFLWSNSLLSVETACPERRRW